MAALGLARGARRDAWVLALAFGAVVAGRLVGGPALAVAIAAAALPVAGFLVAGHLSGRTAGAGCIALALGATLIRPTAGAIAWGDLALLGMVAVAAMVGGSLAE